MARKLRVEYPGAILPIFTKKVSVPAIGEFELRPLRCSNSSPAWRTSLVCSIPVRFTHIYQ